MVFGVDSLPCLLLQNNSMDRGRKGLSPSPPPNRAGGSPAHGSPVGSFLIGMGVPTPRLPEGCQALAPPRRHSANAAGLSGSDPSPDVCPASAGAPGGGDGQSPRRHETS